MDTVTSQTLRGVVRTSLVLLLLFLLLFTLYGVLSAFTGVFTYAIIFSVSFHDLFEKQRLRAGRFKKLPAVIYGLLMVSLVAVPFIFLLNKLGGVLRKVMHTVAEIREGKVPELPPFIQKIPVLGNKVNDAWAHLETDPVGTIGAYEHQISFVLQKMIRGGTGIMGAGLELILGIIVSAVLLHYGRSSLAPLENLLGKLLGVNTAANVLEATGKAIKGVAIGVMGTGLIAGLASWIGYSIVGIAFASVLAAITFFLVVIQVGPLLVILAVVLWLYHEGQTGSAIFVGVYGLVLMGIDNILKPILIGRSGKLPIIVLFLGVVGGMAAWGFTGMFKGAIVLAVFYSLVQTWLTENHGSAGNPDATLSSNQTNDT